MIAIANANANASRIMTWMTYYLLLLHHHPELTHGPDANLSGVHLQGLVVDDTGVGLCAFGEIFDVEHLVYGSADRKGVTCGGVLDQSNHESPKHRLTLGPQSTEGGGHCEGFGKVVCGRRESFYSSFWTVSTIRLARTHIRLPMPDLLARFRQSVDELGQRLGAMRACLGYRA